MSVCTFIASDYPLPEVAPAQKYPMEINIDTGMIYDGGMDGVSGVEFYGWPCRADFKIYKRCFRENRNSRIMARMAGKLLRI